MKILSVIDRQISFQQNMKSSSQVMKLALLEEVGEYVASTGYADWKPTIRDEKNMDIELIDIAIFAINVGYYESKVHHTRKIDPISFEVDLVDEIINLYSNKEWIEIAHLIFNSHPHLLDVVIAKQALNQLRKDYGYKTGEYIKDWNGQEDNVYLEGFYGQDYEEVYDNMEDIYTGKILAARLVNVHD